MAPRPRDTKPKGLSSFGNGVQIEGVRELRAEIRRVKDKEAGKALAAAHRQGAKLVALRARELAPRRSGDLAKSIRWSAGQREGKVKVGVIYGMPIHWGWPRRNIEPQPFLSDAIAEKAGEVRAIVEARIAEILADLDTKGSAGG